MQNNRPVDNPKLQEALDEFKRIMARYDLAGACMLVSPDEAAFTYGLPTSWSAFQFSAEAPLGFTVRAKSSEVGAATASLQIEGAAHTVCQLCDFGTQTAFWMSDLKRLLRQGGVDFEHTPFGGARLEHLAALRVREDK